jgi:hypothetical protein
MIYDIFHILIDFLEVFREIVDISLLLESCDNKLESLNWKYNLFVLEVLPNYRHKSD